MIWLIIVLLFLLVFFCWLLTSTVEVEIDSRVPMAKLRWISFGKVVLWYDDEWRLSIRILFFKKIIRLSEIKSKPEKIKDAAAKKKSKRRMKIRQLLKKAVRIIKTFRVTEWRLAVDTGDHTRNAQLYPLNFLPGTFRHLQINFRDENYLVLKIRNRPWKILYAFLR
ncbi:MAG: hypothetical protein ABI675_16460 [Chitinophagaceae bacterium]